MSEEALSCWIEWKEKCARNLCGKDTSRYLLNFIFPRFLKQSQTAGQGKYAAPGSGEISPDEAWHLFESYFQINTTKTGKHYKNWLFDRVRKSKDQPQQVIESGATLLLRSAVREFLRREYAHSAMTSIQTPISGNNGGCLTLEDLLPGSIDPSDEAVLNEYRDLGEQGAVEIGSTLTEAEKICVLAKHMNVSLAHPVVAEITGKKSTVLYDTYKTFLHRLADTVKKKYPDDEAECIEILTVSTLQALHHLLFEQKKAENGCAELFSV